MSIILLFSCFSETDFTTDRIFIFTFDLRDALLWESGFLAFLIAPWNILIIPWKFGKCYFFKLRRLRYRIFCSWVLSNEVTIINIVFCLFSCRNISRHHDSVMLWLITWLLFRLMFASGVVKLTYMDKTWWDLSALNWHYESQVGDHGE